LIYLIFVTYRDAPEKILLTEPSPLQTPSSFAREKASGFDARDQLSVHSLSRSSQERGFYSHRSRTGGSAWIELQK
jgi:hypothetical protein